MIDQTRLRSVTQKYPYLQGLLFVPIGLWIMLSSSLPTWWPWRNELLLWPATALAVVAYLGIKRYYEQNFGRVVISRSQSLRDGVWTLASVVALGAGLLIDSRLDFPVNAFGAAFALVMLVYWKYVVGLRPHHLILVAGLLVISLLPLWSSVDAGSEITIVGVAQGAAMVVSGLFDHAHLVRSLGPEGLGNASSAGSSRAGA